MPTLCAVDGCNCRATTRGWCGAHYQRWRRHGDPLVLTKVGNGEVLTWIRQTALLHDTDNCLPWPFCRNSDGYGYAWFNGGLHPANRVVCELAHGAPPPDHQAAHSCGNGHLGCVNPRHLRWATVRHNHLDKIGHGTMIRGSRHRLSKLTEKDVLEIRSLSGSVSSLKLAKRYGVSPGLIQGIISGKKWSWLSQ